MKYKHRDLMYFSMYVTVRDLALRVCYGGGVCGQTGNTTAMWLKCYEKLAMKRSYERSYEVAKRSNEKLKGAMKSSQNNDQPHLRSDRFTQHMTSQITIWIKINLRMTN